MSTNHIINYDTHLPTMLTRIVCRLVHSWECAIWKYGIETVNISGQASCPNRIELPVPVTSSYCSYIVKYLSLITAPCSSEWTVYCCEKKVHRVTGTRVTKRTVSPRGCTALHNTAASSCIWFRGFRLTDDNSSCQLTLVVVYDYSLPLCNW